MKQIREEEERKWIDSLKNADSKVQDLNEENRGLKREMKNKDDRELHFEKQTVTRDQEILR